MKTILTYLLITVSIQCFISAQVFAEFCSDLALSSLPAAPRLDINDPENLAGDTAIIEIQGDNFEGREVFTLVQDVHAPQEWVAVRAEVLSSRSALAAIPLDFLAGRDVIEIRLGHLTPQGRCYTPRLQLAVTPFTPNCRPCTDQIRENCSGNIAYLADGGYGDPDDWLATPASVVALFRNNLLQRLVHLEVSNDRFYNSPLYNGIMNDILEYVENELGVAPSITFNGYEAPVQTTEHLATQLGKANYCNPLTLVEAGGYHSTNLAMDVMTRAGRSTLKYIRIVSHSQWNDDYNANGQAFNAGRLFEVYPELLANYTRIADQNGTAWNSNPAYMAGQDPFAFMQNTLLSIVYHHSQLAGQQYWWSACDSSDTGMTHWLLSGVENATLNEVRGLFGY